jgi:hypothetical protein
MAHKKYLCCCYSRDEDACKVLGCDSNSKLAFGATTEVDAMVCRHVLGGPVQRLLANIFNFGGGAGDLTFCSSLNTHKNRQSMNKERPIF